MTFAAVTALPAPDVCEQARLSRDARFDGLFFTAVLSTGIYCRPVCPAPAPLRRNVRYYPSAAAATAAGFRPCLRCRPELAPGAMAHRLGEALIDRALAMIAEGALIEGSVADLAAKLGVGTRHLHRLFVEKTGVGPKAVHDTHRLLLARQLLNETELPVTAVAEASGFASLRRFNAAFRAACAMAPSQVRRQRATIDEGGLNLRLAFRPPFDWEAVLEFLARRSLPGIDRIRQGSYERVAGTPTAPVWLRVSPVAGRSELRLELHGAGPCALLRLVGRVRRVFDLDADPAAIADTLAQAPELAASLRRRPGLRVPGGWDGFETAVRAVLGQQVSVAGARTLAGRLVAEYGIPCGPTPAGFDALDRLFPNPERLFDAPLERIGLPRARAGTLRALAAAVARGEIDFSAGQQLDDFVGRLTALPGIGPWTAHYVALRALGHPDAFPASDLVLRQVLGNGTPVSAREAELRSEAWRPWRGYATVHLWQLSSTHRAAEPEDPKSCATTP